MGGGVKDREMIHKVVVHTVLLYGSESWVVMQEMMKVL